MSSLVRVGAVYQLGLSEKRKLTRIGKGIKYFNPNEVKLPSSDPTTGWTAKSRRTGLIAVKLGMSSSIDEWGRVLPLSILKVDNCQVVQIKPSLHSEDTAYLQLGAGLKKLKNTSKPQMGHFAKANVPPKRKLWEFEVTKDAILPVGTEISALHFVPGQKVDVSGITKGKGFQGAMKRWGFGGLPASHGVSLTHRSLGATGARQDPGKVWKGKKMAGHMGSVLRTMRHLSVFEIDTTNNTIMVVGGVPGAPGTYLRVTDAKGYHFEKPPPFPTYDITKEDKSTIKTTNIFATTKKPILIEEEDMEGDLPTELTQTIKELYPLKTPANLAAKLEDIKIRYKKQLETGHVKEIIENEFPEWLPDKEQVELLEKQDIQSISLKKFQKSQRSDRASVHSKRTDQAFQRWKEKNQAGQQGQKEEEKKE